jgi:hypothetical protein
VQPKKSPYNNTKQMEDLIQELCRMELKQIRHCMKEGKMCDVNHCITRIKLYKNVDLSGGATFWSEYLSETGRTLENSSKEEIIAYLQTHSPSIAQFNGAVNELARYILLKKPSLDVRKARNKAFKLLGKDPEFITSFLEEEEQQQQSLQQLLSLAPSNVIDLTNEVIPSAEVIDLTRTNSGELNVTIDLTQPENTLTESQQNQLLITTTVALLSVLTSSASAQTKAIALALLLLIFQIINKNYFQAQKLLNNIRNRNLNP